MEKLIIPIVITIILIGVTFYVFNNSNGIGNGINTGGNNTKTKIINATS